MTVLGKINKDFLLYNGIYQVTMPRGLGWSFQELENILKGVYKPFLTQSYYEPIQYDLDGKEDLLYWRKLLLSLSGYEFYQKVIVTSLIIAKSYNTYYLIRILHIQ
jgi:uncharacterized alpha-E superfamily protein